MSVETFEAECAMDFYDVFQMVKNDEYFVVTVCDNGSDSVCYLSFEDSLSLAKYIVTELEEEEV